MKDKARRVGAEGESYDYCKDFKILTVEEKRGILKNAKDLLRLQKENIPLADAPLLCFYGNGKAREVREPK
ncbi:hypothetical protein AGMMS49928_24180 [Spirochaetia bacterium]|nr:hypothetical protein AGMMS49928_24180 [Spirochaetia bacterium]